RSAVEDLLF
nr:Chain C, peptide from Spike glycoprotein [Feline coronavirus]